MSLCFRLCSSEIMLQIILIKNLVNSYMYCLNPNHPNPFLKFLPILYRPLYCLTIFTINCMIQEPNFCESYCINRKPQKKKSFNFLFQFYMQSAKKRILLKSFFFNLRQMGNISLDQNKKILFQNVYLLIMTAATFWLLFQKVIVATSVCFE